MQASSRSLTWKQPSLYSNFLYGQNPLSKISTHQAIVPLNTVPSAVEPAAKKQATSKAKSSSGKPYKKTAGGTSIFVGGGNHFHGIAKKPK